MSLHKAKVMIQQPEGCGYLIQTYHYSVEGAQAYIDSLVEQTHNYIAKAKSGKHRTSSPEAFIRKLEGQLENFKKFKIIEVV